MAKAAKKKVYKLKNLLIDRVDLVPKGSNPESHLMLFKAAPEEVDVAKASMTTKEVMAQRRRDHLSEQLWNLRRAFNDSIQSILNDEELAEQEQDAKLQVATAEFVELVRPLMAEFKEISNAQRFALAEASVNALSELAKSFNRSTFDEAVESFTKSLPEESPDMATKAPDKKVEKTEDTEVTIEEVQKSLDDVTAERDQFQKDLADVKAELDELKKAADTSENDTEAIYKGLSEAQQAHFKKMEADAKEASDIAKAERDARVTSECVTFVKSHAAVSTLSETDDMEMLKFLKGHEGGKYLDRLSQILKSKVEVAKAGGDEIFTEKGHGQEPELSESAVDRVNKMAAAEIEKDKDLTLNDAVAKILNSDPKLYTEYSKSMSTRV